MSNHPEIRREVLRTASDLLVLSILADAPAYGYLISKKVAARSGGALRITPGTMYPLLHQLENKGLLDSEWDSPRSTSEKKSSSGRRRKWYRITKAGKRRLARRADSHRACQALINSFLPNPGIEGSKT